MILTPGFQCPKQARWISPGTFIQKPDLGLPQTLSPSIHKPSCSDQLLIPPSPDLLTSKSIGLRYPPTYLNLRPSAKGPARSPSFAPDKANGIPVGMVAPFPTDKKIRFMPFSGIVAEISQTHLRMGLKPKSQIKIRKKHDHCYF